VLLGQGTHIEHVHTHVRTCTHTHTHAWTHGRMCAHTHIHTHACTNAGLAALGSNDEEVFEDVKNILYTDSAVSACAAIHE